MTSSPMAVAGNLADTQPANKLYYPAFDGLRAIAFLLVFAQHYANLPFGWSGVDVFFVLSGFLITGVLYDTRHDPHRVRNFYVRRSLRIFPLYYAVFLLALILTIPLRLQWNLGWIVWPLYLGNFATYLHAGPPGSPAQLLGDAQLFSLRLHIPFFLGHFWSLCVEEQFYLIWPFFIFLIRDRKKLIAICLAAILLEPLVRSAGTFLIPQDMQVRGIFTHLLFFRADALLLGGLLALWLRGDKARWLSKPSLILNIIYTALIGIAVLWVIGARSGRLHLAPAVSITVLVLIDLLAATTLIKATHPNSFVYRLLVLPPLRWLGRISYGAYVWHGIFQVVYNRWAQSLHLQAPHLTTLASCIIGLSATCLLSWASFHFLEAPFLELKSRFTR